MREAHVVTTFKEGTSKAVGHSRCSECGGAVDPDDRYCRHCGARFRRDDGKDVRCEAVRH